MDHLWYYGPNNDFGSSRGVNSRASFPSGTPSYDHLQYNTPTVSEQDLVHDEASKSRKRVTLACARCRKRKIKCSGPSKDGMACDACKGSGVDPETCIFPRAGVTSIPLADIPKYTQQAGSIPHGIVGRAPLDIANHIGGISLSPNRSLRSQHNISSPQQLSMRTVPANAVSAHAINRGGLHSRPTAPNAHTHSFHEGLSQGEDYASWKNTSMSPHTEMGHVVEDSYQLPALSYEHGGMWPFPASRSQLTERLPSITAAANSALDTVGTSSSLRAQTAEARRLPVPHTASHWQSANLARPGGLTKSDNRQSSFILQGGLYGPVLQNEYETALPPLQYGSPTSPRLLALSYGSYSSPSMRQTHGVQGVGSLTKGASELSLEALDPRLTKRTLEALSQPTYPPSASEIAEQSFSPATQTKPSQAPLQGRRNPYRPDSTRRMSTNTAGLSSTTLHQDTRYTQQGHQHGAPSDTEGGGSATDGTGDGEDTDHSGRQVGESRGSQRGASTAQRMSLANINAPL